ncbi:hypothetical protein TNCV_1431821 [Trichonephila clavipes]|nr:hypothetical protein TNCV_1431821 [Trichonephila clavipes]
MFDLPIRTLSTRQAHPHQATSTNSIWDGGMLRVPFPSDIQRHHDGVYGRNDSDGERERIIRMDLVILNRGQETRIPELAPHSPNLHTTPMRGFSATIDLTCISHSKWVISGNPHD